MHIPSYIIKAFPVHLILPARNWEEDINVTCLAIIFQFENVKRSAALPASGNALRSCQARKQENQVCCLGNLNDRRTVVVRYLIHVPYVYNLTVHSQVLRVSLVICMNVDNLSQYTVCAYISSSYPMHSDFPLSTSTLYIFLRHLVGMM